MTPRKGAHGKTVCGNSGQLDFFLNVALAFMPATQQTHNANQRNVPPGTDTLLNTVDLAGTLFFGIMISVSRHWSLPEVDAG